MLDVTVTADGRVINPIVIKGLDWAWKKKRWRRCEVENAGGFGAGGKPVACRVQIEVTFHLY